MDLAKIRKKALHAQTATSLVERPALAPPGISQAPLRMADLWSGGTGEHTTENHSDLALTTAESLQHSFQPLPVHRNARRSPLEIILAGRADAGCDAGVQADLQEQVASTDAAFEEFLCIRVSDEIYGINIMQIKEIITPKQVTEVPRAPSFVCGVISLRGVIIPVLDMNNRLGLNRTVPTGRERVVVVKSESNGERFTGLLVDRVTHVARILSNGIEGAPLTLDGIDRDFIRGIGRADNQLLILLNVETVVDFHLT